MLAPEPAAPVVPLEEPPTFAVVIAAYNVAPFLAETVASAQAQTVAPAEIIVVDDGSTDHIDAVLAGLSPGVTVLRQRNGGEGAAKNAGWRHATADFVVFLDGDDLFAPERIEAMQWLAMQRPDLDVLLTDLVEFGPRARTWVVDGEPMTNAKVFPVRDQRRVLLERALFHVPAIRRSMLERVGGMSEDRALHRDWEVAVRLALAGATAGMVPLALYHYRRWEGQTTAQDHALRVADLHTLHHVRQFPELDDAERAIVDTTIRRTQLELWRLTRDSGHPEARRRARAVVADPAVRALERRRARLTVLSPRVSRWVAAVHHRRRS